MIIIKAFIIFNLILFFFNLFLILKNEKIYKNVDFPIIYFLKESYKNISDILNNKYRCRDLFLNNLNSNSDIINKIESKNITKIIRIYFIDFHLNSPYHKRQIKNIIAILSKKFKIKIYRNNPEYLFYNVFGCNHLQKQYKNAIKIALYTENQITDFNIADYSLGGSHINFLDRAFKLPYFFGIKNYSIQEINDSREFALKQPIRQKFCSAVISNFHRSNKFRIKFINELIKYKKVDMGGKFRNNVGRIKNKIKFLEKYKFSIAMENSEGDGYISEKIIQSFLSGTIPIYYGDYIIDEYINPNSFILVRGDKDLISKIKYIKKIDKNNTFYKKKLKEKVFVDLKFKEIIEKEKEEFLYHIFSQDLKKAKRVDNYHWKNDPL